MPLPPKLAATYRGYFNVSRLVQRWLTPLFDLALRLYIAEIFFRAGWLKLADWPATLDLFKYVYQVPLISPGLAAISGATGEIVLPVLLVLGIFGRFTAAGLFVINLMAAISFPDISDLGLQDHVLWGGLLMVPVFYGAGTISIDAMVARRFARLTEES